MYQSNCQLLPLIGVSDAINNIRGLIDMISDNDLSVLICGESGVGKEIIAQNIHGRSAVRRHNPLIKINCAALPEHLFENELFGYAKDATDCVGLADKKGKFELAHNGVLFLDEIGEMPLAVQAKLLHVLESGQFLKAQSGKDITVDVRVVSATNEDLDLKIERNLFRQDLYYRLNMIKIDIPPLRYRVDDIEPIANHFVKILACGGPRDIKIPSHVCERLRSFRWKGNVRELQNTVKNYVLFGSWDKVLDDLEMQYNSQLRAQEIILKPDLVKLPSTANFSYNDPSIFGNIDFSLALESKKASEFIERQLIKLALDKTGWNRGKSAKLLKIGEKTLYRKMKELYIQPVS